jgi:hypothetical protein
MYFSIVGMTSTFTLRGGDAVVQGLFISFRNLSTSETGDIYITKNRFLRHLCAFLFMCKCVCMLVTEIAAVCYAWSDVKMVHFDYARFLSALCVHGVVFFLRT